MRDMLDARKRGDLAFRDKEFKTAIDCYSQVNLSFSIAYTFFCVLCGKGKDSCKRND